MTQETFLFLGDSLVADFDWQARMHHFTVLNYGMAGDTTQGLLNRIPAITEEVQNPGLILLMIGTNNLIIEDYSFVATLHKIIVELTSRYPAAEVITNSLLPCHLPWLKMDSLKRLNTDIEAITLQSGCCYLDMFSKFEPTSEFFQNDGIHLTPKAYDLWAKNILEFVSFLIEDD
ncbi:MAG: GDSL-type esterase/lipase family protein [Thermodesulfobacteriota bacterium]